MKRLTALFSEPIIETQSGYFTKYRDITEKPNFHKKVTYPDISVFNEEMSRGVTNRFLEDLCHFIIDFQDKSVDICNSLLFIIDNFRRSAFPKNAKGKHERLNYYSKDFIKYLEDNNFEIIKNVTGVYSLTVFRKKRYLNSEEKFLDLTEGFRITYEVIDERRMIFTNVDYHVYRDSQYTVVD